MQDTLSLRDLFAPVEAPLGAVRGEIARIWQDALSLAPMGAGEGLSAPGGKMLRPALCLMAAGAIGAEDLGRYVRCAAAFEALHIASLAHDDVIDHALLRRGKASLNGLWNNHAAVLGGDYLVARSIEMLCEYDCCAVVARAVTTVRRMAEGELYFFGREADSIREADCIHLAEQKTAALFAEACSAPTYLIDPAHRGALYGYGIGLGVAFQIVDDLLDVTQSAGQLGKPSCGDVAEGKATLPILFMREALDAAGRARLDALRGAELSDADRAWIVDTAQATGAAERTAQAARDYTADALRHLHTLPPTPYRDAMEGMLEFVLVRLS